LDNGTFSTQLLVQEAEIIFKFVVDGEWKTSDVYKVVTDDQVCIVDI
jgi:hypothetical protein